jgi:CDP-glucose 4,6-dehydratase
MVPIQALRNLPGPILVTGHTGFKGAWLMFLLSHLEIPHVGVALPPKSGSLYERAGLLGAQPEIFGDIKDKDVLTEAFGKFSPSAVIHLAAQALVLESYRDPVGTFETNVMGTVNILASAFNCPSVRSIALATTDKVYENRELSRRFSENDSLKGKDPYSASKVGAEAAIAAWQQISMANNGPSVIALRSGNVIGGGDFSENRLLPDLVRSVGNEAKAEIRNPNSTRPWQHALDPLFGYLLALAKGLEEKNYKAYNFGPDLDSLTVHEVISTFSEEWPEVKYSLSQAAEKGVHIEAQNLDLSAEKAKRDLRWTPVWSQLDAVALTARWWKEHLNANKSAFDLCSTEVTNFLNK